MGEEGSGSEGSERGSVFPLPAADDVTSPPPRPPRRHPRSPRPPPPRPLPRPPHGPHLSCSQTFSTHVSRSALKARADPAKTISGRGGTNSLVTWDSNLFLETGRNPALVELSFCRWRGLHAPILRTNARQSPPARSRRGHRHPGRAGGTLVAYHASSCCRYSCSCACCPP